MEQPHNLEAEEALLACCLLNNASYDSISTIVNEDDFYRSANKILFGAISKLCATGDEFSEIDLDELLKREGTDKEVGGLGAIMHIQRQVSSSMQIVSFAKIVKEKSKLRQIIRTSGQRLSPYVKTSRGWRREPTIPSLYQLGSNS